jgi:hypothetical protein
MKTCSSCNTYAHDNAEYCEYCGEIFYKEYKVFSEIANIFHSKSVRDRKTIFPFEKNRQLCLKIDQENQRVNDIQILLENIKNNNVKQKINNIVIQIMGYIVSLVKCRCDIEFIRISTSLNALMIDGRKIKSEELVKYCDEFKNELNNTFSEIKKLYNLDSLESYFEEKKVDMDKMIENISVLLISSILSNTSIMKELEYNPESHYRTLEENIDKINYEIDRLSAELSM